MKPTATNPKSRLYQAHVSIWSNVTVSGDEYIPTLHGYKPGAYFLRSWEGALGFKSRILEDQLEGVFFLFNQDDRPNRTIAHSLSVGDVVELDGDLGEAHGVFAVESLGFKRIEDFDPDGPHPAHWKKRGPATTEGGRV